MPPSHAASASASVSFFDHYATVQTWIAGQLRRSGLKDDALVSDGVARVQHALERTLQGERGIDTPGGLRNFLSSFSRWTTLKLRSQNHRDAHRFLGLPGDDAETIPTTAEAPTDRRIDARRVLREIAAVRALLSPSERHALDVLMDGHACDESCKFFSQKPAARRVARHRVRERLRELIPAVNDLIPRGDASLDGEDEM